MQYRILIVYFREAEPLRKQMSEPLTNTITEAPPPLPESPCPIILSRKVPLTVVSLNHINFFITIFRRLFLENRLIFH